jgi:hypothetical protein
MEKGEIYIIYGELVNGSVGIIPGKVWWSLELIWSKIVHEISG